MLNLVSLGIGAVTFILALIAFLPLLGWANWLLVPFGLIGLVLGAMSRSNLGRNVNILVLAICVLRLSLGGGIF